MDPDIFLPHILSLMPGRMIGRALDIGSGRGRNSLYLAQAGWHVVSLEPSIRRLRYASNRAGDLREDIDSVLGIGERLPVKDSTFQLVLCNHVLESLPVDTAGQVVQEIYRVVKPGGYLFVETAASDNGYAAGDINGIAGRFHLYAEDEFVEMMSGFELIEMLHLRLVKPKSTPPSAQWIYLGRKSALA
ncbi:MAG: class I SAM-dependent methyltransferase [Dehalococcoidia bacterium]|nr:class I SAM-dependent methyltransferase [Dehalococcoidia bacterium]